MRSLLIYLKDYKKESVLAPLFKMLEASFELLVPLVMAAVIDVGIARKDTAYIIRMCLVLVALGMIGLVCSITAQYFAAKAAAGFGTGVRHALFEHIQGFTFTEMDMVGSTTLITRMTSDINQVQSGVNLVLRLFLRSPFIVFGAMIMAFTVDVKAALIFAVAIPVLSVIVFGIMLITMPLYRKVQADLDNVLLMTRENLTGVRVIRAFNKEKDEQKRFEEGNQVLTDAQKFVGRISGLMNPLTYIVVNGAVIVLIYAGALRVDAGDLTQGAVVALLNYMSQILVELVKLANLIITVTKAIACGNRIGAVLNEESDMENGTLDWPEDTDVPAVEFTHVSLRYRGAAGDALSDISFRAEQGQTIGIIGGTAFQIEQGGSNLSGGQKQRLTIARALVRRPRILILDDSASALDFATDARLRAAIRGMGEKPTVFIVSQRASSIQYADQIIVLEDGRAAGIGTHEELIESCPVYQEIYYSQFPKEAANG